MQSESDGNNNIKKHINKNNNYKRVNLLYSIISPCTSKAKLHISIEKVVRVVMFNFPFTIVMLALNVFIYYVQHAGLYECNL